LSYLVSFFKANWRATRVLRNLFCYTLYIHYRRRLIHIPLYQVKPLRTCPAIKLACSEASQISPDSAARRAFQPPPARPIGQPAQNHPQPCDTPLLFDPGLTSRSQILRTALFRGHAAGVRPPAFLLVDAAGTSAPAPMLPAPGLWLVQGLARFKCTACTSTLAVLDCLIGRLPFWRASSCWLPRPLGCLAGPPAAAKSAPCPLAGFPDVYCIVAAFACAASAFCRLT
jgi:hypothetical protein